MKHASDFLRRPIPRRYPWRQWARLTALAIGYVAIYFAALVGIYTLLVIGLAL